MSRRALFAVALASLPLITPAQQTRSPQIPNRMEAPLEGAAGLRDGERVDEAVIDEIIFAGMRRIPEQTLQDKIVSRRGEKFSAERVRRDVHRLGELGWFGSVRVESADVPVSPAEEVAQPRIRLIYVVEELPFLTEVEYGGARLLSRRQIETLLAQKKVAPKVGEPEDRVTLHHAAREIEGALRELGYPDARVAVHEQVLPNATVHARLEINDGPRVPVGRVLFAGRAEIPERRLRREMRRLAPDALFARWRAKTSYTREAFEEDRERLLRYYSNHGYPEARVGVPETARIRMVRRAWLPWPRKTGRELLQLRIPVQAGPLYRMVDVEVSEELREMAARHDGEFASSRALQSGAPFSAEAVEDLRRKWETAARAKWKRGQNGEPRAVEAIQTTETTTHTVAVKLRLGEAQPYVVRRLEFRGLRRFPDRYFRKRIALKEGASLDERALEQGLMRLARTGYFKAIKKEDVSIKTDEATHTADVTIHVEEKGQQRVSLVGGRGQFGSTVGIAYMVYNLLDREELLSSRIEGGPESLQLALSLAKEGVFGSRGTLAFSVFNSFLRPRLIGTVKGPFLEQRSAGMSADWSYALSETDTMSVDYGLSRSTTKYSLGLPPGLTGLPAEVRAGSSSHALGLGWERDTGKERMVFADSVSGGLLGGSENLLRAKAEYGRIFNDELFKTRNSWAFRSSFSGAGSYSGEMPVYSRWFVGDQFVRGLRDGELGPEAMVSSTSGSVPTLYSTTPAGANAIAAMNAEYRMRLRGAAETAVFFDLGSGRLLPNWAGPNRPALVSATNGLLHGSTGIEVRWMVPGVNVPVRVYYAMNVLRLNRMITLPDGSLFRVGNRFSGLGWGLGAMF